MERNNLNKIAVVVGFGSAQLGEAAPMMNKGPHLGRVNNHGSGGGKTAGPVAGATCVCSFTARCPKFKKVPSEAVALYPDPLQIQKLQQQGLCTVDPVTD